MSDQAKIMLSPAELASAADKNVILTKTAVIQKAFELFGSMTGIINEVWAGKLMSDEKLSSSVPKISKGENYKGFPYVILDYPSAFSKENIFALRTMFLWGHFVSIALHLSGKYAAYVNRELAEKDPELFIAAGEAEWEHGFDENNFILLSSLDPEHKKNLYSRDFIKIAYKYELSDWNNLPQLLPEGYQNLANKLKNYPTKQISKS